MVEGSVGPEGYEVPLLSGYEFVEFCNFVICDAGKNIGEPGFGSTQLSLAISIKAWLC